MKLKKSTSKKTSGRPKLKDKKKSCSVVLTSDERKQLECIHGTLTNAIRSLL